MNSHLLVWSGLGAFRTEIAHVRLEPEGLSARGTQIAIEPEGYQLEYRLATDDRLITTRLEVEVKGDGWQREIDLRRDSGGEWKCEARAIGKRHLVPPGGDARAFRTVLDCDLAFSPLTNLMPVRREGLLLGGGPRDFVMAWVAVPSLQVLPSEQTYEHVRRDADGSVIRYTGRHRGFTGELRFDEHGFIRLYPHLAIRRWPRVSTKDVDAAADDASEPFQG